MIGQLSSFSKIRGIRKGLGTTSCFKTARHHTNICPYFPWNAELPRTQTHTIRGRINAVFVLVVTSMVAFSRKRMLHPEQSWLQMCHAKEAGLVMEVLDLARATI